MRYIGGKSLLLDSLLTEIKDMRDIHTILDIFSGSGVVGAFFAGHGYKVLSNDLLYFSYVLARGTIGIEHEPKFRELGIADVINYLNTLDISDTEYAPADCFVYRNYSPNENCGRMYFQNHNAMKIDVIRMRIEDWKNAGVLSKDAYFYLLAALINAVPYVSNITGTYGAYLKYWDKRTYDPLQLKKPKLVKKAEKADCYNLDYKQMLGEQVDLLYADPPYNSREYLPNYHILETIARYDRPSIKGITGIREYKEQKSDFCKKATVEHAFESLLRDAKAKYILISYNNEGLISTAKLSEICQSYAKGNSFHLTEIAYRRYKNKIPNNTEGLKEQLYFLRRN